MRHLRSFVLFFGLALGQASSADSTLEFLVAEDGEKPAKLQSLLIKDGKILLKGAGGGGSLDLIYSASPEQLSIIDHAKRHVMTLDESQVNRIAQQAETVQPLLQGFGEQIAKLSPKQRAQWEDMLGGKLSLDAVAAAAQPTPKAKIVKTGQTRQVGGIACEQIGVFQGKRQTAEFCLADPSKLNLPDSDYSTLRSLLGFSERLANKSQGLAKHFGLNLPNLDWRNLAGIPIALGGAAKQSAKSVRLSRIFVASAITPDTIKIPDGYQSEPFKLWN
ncbi:MAG: hypothetical protein ACKN9T_04350 [Candidatus Methylumidiphilus sp.]